MPISKLTPEIITAAIAGFEQQKVRIDSQIAELRAMLPGASAETVASEGRTRRRRGLSAAARKRIADAQKARWAKLRGGSGTTAAPAPKAKRKLSAAARARLAANLKKARAAKAAKAKEAAKKAARARRKAAAQLAA